ncbi:hypothetical protein GUITHDRAFT_148977 [Guillardia theta CCMP2712]|uniref:CUB domain-containing protein n=1 Tax=Guillardia theta (strain CCMP2712) TaxID=905079 RepID=L1I7T2_GUITC|nr:hypothetical protein GUITHDRAFT_148977 [Guillardia theta CCMP2712]EKX31920.1 hypothetical protein GUITHDRAFT_148977 [Guillardia theta CCMP2712]|eukprot:XP_005818900.1 hypothetical protein GUITHDRAFT_148977 [Guillardia theta CCMP2712]
MSLYSHSGLSVLVLSCLLMNLGLVWAAIPVSMQDGGKMEVRSVEEIVSCAGQFSLGLNASLECSKDFFIEILVCQDVFCASRSAFGTVCGSTLEKVPVNFGLYINLTISAIPSPSGVNFSYVGLTEGCTNETHPIRSNSGQVSESMGASSDVCSWLIQPPGISRVVLSLRTFDLEQTSCTNRSETYRVYRCLSMDCAASALAQLFTCENVSNSTMSLDSEYGVKIDLDRSLSDTYTLQLTWDSSYSKCPASETLLSSEIINVTNGFGGWHYNYNCQWFETIVTVYGI